MESIGEFSTRVISSYERYNRSKADRVEELRLNLKNYLVALFKALKTINESGEDCQEKISELETRYGIPVKHL